ncbi:hypothetical protein D9758_013197 [Tetrapyrgos nigripes]|uniref:Uncharacterized protein n=1 Tax=Tetrapyrgos nigripes TaxID=182062 RepID=A0A8H5FRN8_9AGAR|nr:hypothetical protein D9758_013197 [Tetrapyrgos nigripes]
MTLPFSPTPDNTPAKQRHGRRTPIDTPFAYSMTLARLPDADDFLNRFMDDTIGQNELEEPPMGSALPEESIDHAPTGSLPTDGAPHRDPESHSLIHTPAQDALGVVTDQDVIRIITQARDMALRSRANTGDGAGNATEVKCEAEDDEGLLVSVKDVVEEEVEDMMDICSENDEQGRYDMMDIFSECDCSSSPAYPRMGCHCALMQFLLSVPTLILIFLSLCAHSDFCSSLFSILSPRPSLLLPTLALILKSVTQSQLTRAKDLVLDLLGWGVSPEYLIHIGVSSQTIYRVFTDLNLRLPRNLRLGSGRIVTVTMELGVKTEDV